MTSVTASGDPEGSISIYIKHYSSAQTNLAIKKPAAGAARTWLNSNVDYCTSSDLCISYVRSNLFLLAMALLLIYNSNLNIIELQNHFE